MNRFIFATKEEMGAWGAGAATEALGQAIASKNQANLILATGAGQFERLDRLTATPGIDWSKVGMFHLDEYIGLGPDHPASILQEHGNGSLFLDEPAASQLPAES